jgi:uncharacterized membrane protein (GlpM family)
MTIPLTSIFLQLLHRFFGLSFDIDGIKITIKYEILRLLAIYFNYLNKVWKQKGHYMKQRPFQNHENLNLMGSLR